jgi:hypothetical protein
MCKGFFCALPIPFGIWSLITITGENMLKREDCGPCDGLGVVEQGGWAFVVAPVCNSCKGIGRKPFSEVQLKEAARQFALKVFGEPRWEVWGLRDKETDRLGLTESETATFKTYVLLFDRPIRGPGWS